MSVRASAGPTVGREPELAQLEAALDALSQGESGCIALEGEPGIGKTRLLGELRRRAEERGCLALAGVAAEFERDLPFSVWVDALDAYVVAQQLDLEESWDPELLEELAGVLPSLKRPGGAAAAPSLADERFRVHRAMRALLEVLARDRPLVLMLDDLHWSDGASLELIAALLRRGTDVPVLLALAFRPGQAPARLATALAVRSARRITLQQLDEAQAGELLGDLDPRSAAAIFRHGGGNPFYLEQLARAKEEGKLEATLGDGGTAAGVPLAVAASLAEELADLSATERALLEAAAVAGEPFEPDVAAAIAELAEADALTALDALLTKDLLRPTTVPRRFIFRHPLVRRAVYESARGGWRLAAHRRAAVALAERGAGPAERAHHVEHSASQGDDDAIALLLEAGTGSAARAPAAAVRWFEAALRLLPDADRARQVDVRVSLASALRALGELERCRATLVDALDLLPADAGRRVELIAQCAAVEHWQGRHAEAHDRLVRAWEELPEGPTAASAALEVELAVDGLYELDFEQTLAHGRGALETARTVGDRALLALAASAVCLGESAAGEIEAAREHYAEARALVDRLSDDELAPRLEALCYLGWAENYLEHYDEAIAHADRGVAIARATGEGRLLVPMMLVKGYPFEMQGRMAECIELCETAVEVTRLSPNPHYLFWSLFELGFARYFSGDLEAAIAAGEQSADVGKRLTGGTMPSAGGGPGWLLAAARFEAGEVQRAREDMRALGSVELEHKIPAERCFDWETMALVELAVGERAAAEDLVRRAEENAARLGLKMPAALAGRARAELLLADGDALEAARVAQASFEAASSVGARLQAAYSRALAGRALAAAGRRTEAVETLRAAEADLDACGSVRVRDEMRRELRKLGARAEVRGPAVAGDSGVAALTKRELEIAELVTDRHTNREIAATLFLSDKTIESHLRNIFVKLGVSSRVAVARAVEHERRGGDPANSG